MDERIYMRARQEGRYDGTVAKVMGQGDIVTAAGFKRLALVDRSGAGILGE